MVVTLPPLQAAPVLAGRSLAAWWWELHLACGAGNTRGSEQKKRSLLKGVPPGSSQRTPWLRLVDGSSGRYAGRLVPGSLQAVAATMSLQAQPHHRVKQLLYKQTGWHGHHQEALHAPCERLSEAWQDLVFTEWW